MPQSKSFNVTVRVFDAHAGLASGEDFVLPVDSPDAEHAAASTMANAISWTTKTKNGTPLPIAFACMAVSERA